MTVETTGTMMETGTTEPGKASGRFTSSIRFRLLGWFVLLLTLATVASVLVVREILYMRVDESIEDEFVQESKELRALASGTDPETGDAFGSDVERIFEVFLERNTPSPNQSLITFIDGQPFLRSRRVAPYRLDTDPELIELWSSVRSPARGTVDTPAGVVEYLAIPIRSGGETNGVFVDAWFLDLERAEANPAIAGATGIGFVVLLIGSFLAWWLAGRILVPIAAIRSAADAMSETDLTRRIDVKGDDEIAELARTFNGMLDRLDEAFSTQRRFIDDASHELRTPITVIQGHLELLEDDPGERTRTLELVMDELDRMNRFVSDLLLLSRTQRPDFLNLSTVDVGPLLDEIHSKSSVLAERDWRVENQGGGRIVADRQRITQAMMQLAQNATQYTATGDTISIGSSGRDGWIRLWVSDTGSGISEQEKSRIFDRFTRGRGLRRSEGAGLGLAIVQAIAEAHHGTIELDSEVGEGATFTIVLPIEGPQPMDGNGK